MAKTTWNNKTSKGVVYKNGSTATFTKTKVNGKPKLVKSGTNGKSRGKR